MSLPVCWSAPNLLHFQLTIETHRPCSCLFWSAIQSRSCTVDCCSVTCSHPVQACLSCRRHPVILWWEGCGSGMHLSPIVSEDWSCNIGDNQAMHFQHRRDPGGLLVPLSWCTFRSGIILYGNVDDGSDAKTYLITVDDLSILFQYGDHPIEIWSSSDHRRVCSHLYTAWWFCFHCCSEKQAALWFWRLYFHPDL